MSAYKVLYIEDDRTNQIVIQRVLEAKHITILLADTATEGLQMVHEHAESLNLILLDINLPDMSGFEVMDEIRIDSSLSHIPVIAVTAMMTHDKPVYLNRGFADLIYKPVTSAKLMTSLNLYGVMV
jgi:CheY-like chemotaxis protein